MKRLAHQRQTPDAWWRARSEHLGKLQLSPWPDLHHHLGLGLDPVLIGADECLG
ncbi:hypothetical protein [Phyllobacterium sophorae]|uniref:hypothetical protein n=1 Tax=Phyllobacterium sophorae TaxID=1520277 RepID=UPI001AED04E8|nr:hypothetical protein [Phyllobacterium sophorae]